MLFRSRLGMNAAEAVFVRAAVSDKDSFGSVHAEAAKALQINFGFGLGKTDMTREYFRVEGTLQRAISPSTDFRAIAI